ncbi:MAG: DUF3179 domain-containing protein [Chloroflexi bacterium]|nr:DUF3179 domain-containing protein [Chloroflexota bacterium]
MNDSVGGPSVVTFWQPDVTSPLDATTVPGGRVIGSAAGFSPLLNGEQLTFSCNEGAITDSETDSTWGALGLATVALLAGKALAPVIAIKHPWFS